MYFFTKERILALAKAYNYDVALEFVLECPDDETFKKYYPELYNRIYQNFHCRDGRGPLGYAQNLVRNWVFEDTFVICLRKCGIDVHLNGAEAERQFLSAGTITQAPDTRIENLVLSDGRTISVDVELIKISSKRWEYNDEIDTLRDNKVPNLINDKALCFCCEDTKDDGLKFAIVDFGKEDLVTRQPRANENFYGKLVTPVPLSLNFIEFESFDFNDMSNVRDSIEEILSEREDVEYIPKDCSIPLF